MSDANRGVLSYVEESAWGAMPASALTDLRITDDSFGHGITNTESREIRSDRQTTDLIQTGAEAAGGFNFELSYESPPDQLLEGALFTDWPAAVSTVTATDISAEADPTNTITTVAEDWVAAGFVVGQWVEVRGFTGAVGNNGYHQITALSTTVMTFGNSTLALDAAGESVTVKGHMIRNGTTEHSYSIQRELEDAIQFFLYRGQIVSSFGLTATANSVVTGGFEFTGADIASTDLAQASHGTGANIAAPNNDVMSAVTNVGQILEGATLTAVAADLYIQEISFKVMNNLRPIGAVGTLGSADVGVGKCTVTGTLNVMFNDETLYDKYLAGTETALSFKLEDADGNAYIITFPRIKFESDDGGKLPGIDSDVVEGINWRALRDATTDCMIQIDKFAA